MCSAHHPLTLMPLLQQSMTCAFHCSSFACRFNSHAPIFPATF
ncbi:hypothetical protein HMPREF1546_00385 [Oscillibacter sp. KLE 1745]|nr:hypothetical protein HMPREF1546_00385 [Oscillibacter sp. KLE 1745]